ncbi:HCL061Cp [Eremothecium sinecaudum]|uniref:HCL061Cp n=1 Tax=Eremothecium sinecaudum TaxID=45286 RepID=A0A0X8HRH1_9SACH|nr:HCL061Cp [Eremothecium sinecaudum]AMD20090.1 HCL061Cp [Eremothecium sinecaudum]
MLSMFNAIRRLTASHTKVPPLNVVPERVFTLQDYLKDPLKIIVIPVTTEKCYFYFKHTKELLNTKSKFVRYEQKMIQKATNVWRNMEKSTNVVTIQIVAWVNLLLVRIAWIERSLTSFPSESYILKRVELVKKRTAEVMNLRKGDELQLSGQELKLMEEVVNPKPVHVYYPRSIVPENVVVSELNQLWQRGKKVHKKYFYLCLLGLPLTIPIAIVPLLPNIPGFYLAYRAYCNYKAYAGARHLESLMQGNGKQHVDFVDLKEYSEMLTDGGSTGYPAFDAPESMLLNNNLLDKLMDNLSIHEIRRDLTIAMKQEKRRLMESTQGKSTRKTRTRSRKKAKKAEETESQQDDR